MNVVLLFIIWNIRWSDPSIKLCFVNFYSVYRFLENIFVLSKHELSMNISQIFVDFQVWGWENQNLVFTVPENKNTLLRVNKQHKNN